MKMLIIYYSQSLKPVRILSEYKIAKQNREQTKALSRQQRSLLFLPYRRNNAIKPIQITSVPIKPHEDSDHQQVGT